MTDAELTAIDLWASGWAGEGSAEFSAVTRLVAFARKQREQLNEYWRAVVRLEEADAADKVNEYAAAFDALHEIRTGNGFADCPAPFAQRMHEENVKYADRVKELTDMNEKLCDQIAVLLGRKAEGQEK